MRASGCLRKLPYGVCLVAMTYSDPVNDRAGRVGSKVYPNSEGGCGEWEVYKSGSRSL